MELRMRRRRQQWYLHFTLPTFKTMLLSAGFAVLIKSAGADIRLNQDHRDISIRFSSFHSGLQLFTFIYVPFTSPRTNKYAHNPHRTQIFHSQKTGSPRYPQRGITRISPSLSQKNSIRKENENGACLCACPGRCGPKPSNAGMMYGTGYCGNICL
jgi:hypothetical protein